MDYKKKYKEALKRAKNLHKDAIEMENNMTTKTCEIIFPELKENEDERIRRNIIAALKGEGYYDCDLTNECIAWLEKQGMSYTKRDVDDAYLKGVTDAKNEIEKQYETNYQIRKDIATFIFNYRGDIKDRAKWMDYLGIKVSFVEKQGEQKPQGKTALEAINEEKVDNQICIKPADKAEPKFHEGEWITNGDYTWKIIEVKPLDYILQSQDGNIVDDTISYVDEQFHSFTIEDAKAGDVLYSLDSKQPFIFKHRKPNEQAKVYCGINIYGKFFVGNTKDCIITTDKYIPATKEQRNTLERAMDDAGYTFDFESKELKEIEPIPAWSKEDEAKFEEAICMIESNGKWVRSEDAVKQLSSWLKSLKDRVQTLAKIEKGIK